MATVGLKPVHVAALTAVKAFCAEHGRVPSNIELAGVLGVSESTISQRLSVLAARGWIVRQATGKRPFVLTDKAHAWGGA